MVIFTSGSPQFLKDLLKVLKENLPLKLEKVYTSHRSFQLSFSTKDSIMLFKFMYGNLHQKIFLMRKYQKFIQYFQLKPKTVDKKVKSIIGYLNGHVVK